MFLWDRAVRRADLARRRGLALGVESPLGCDIVDELHRWVVSLPWVVVLESLPGEPTVGRFAVDCPPLECTSVWLTLGPFDEPDGRLDVRVALPRTLAHRGVAVGWAVPMIDLSGDKVVVGVATPTTTTELRAVEALLGVAYSAAFPTDEVQAAG